jgi:hypothetical protein
MMSEKPFLCKVWEAMQNVPRGEILITYLASEYWKCCPAGSNAQPGLRMALPDPVCWLSTPAPLSCVYMSHTSSR